MTTVANLLTLMPWVAAAIVALVLAAIGIAIWIILPTTAARDRDSDIERQIKSLRQGADHSVATRPRVRAHSSRADLAARGTTPTVAHKACGGGMCRHRADCADHFCPGRISATLTSTEARHARH